MNNIDQIMYLLDWKRSEIEQQQGISMARKVSCIKVFFQPIGPGYSKSVWENCAVIICERSDEELDPYITDMLLWLEDLNWPGAQLIQERLCSFHNVSRLSSLLNEMVPALEILGKKSWLSFISELLTNPQIAKCLNSNTINILSRYSNF